MDTKTDQKPLYNPTQAAAAVGVSRQTIYNWLDAGKITATQRDVEGRPLFTVDDVQGMRAMLGG